ncbi:MAG: prepilin-type N-terminal cleavage/methylation domain-containing protein [Rickettsiales bacterium]|nr:prepilin-type N-terminal cleavage/methylation domain-containing protein [Pseudomonadota bacterium]MDA0967451.1 prepilin-type N-terminal cleavage/methylation domain-containing protein [Pseudomonadota bacterium]MDG4544181.1 prepilin-type N-terminal cleavage/methylation domain-containing protein [Rickettsiales bacterium]MDG4546362.1 prepilin-type N-terminal cleavage/methylation domain-containing protein [Rickettsiales bacterium]MDG4548505.1 prepilin-type N-terminal cleavage/methylation domain-c
MDTNNGKVMNYPKGFSLVELSIVLVVIGILVGIVTAGVTIQKTSELRSIISQVEQLKIAVEAFDDKYEDLPGDMSDAHDYWDDGANGVCGTAAQCNGNGDGDIDIGSGDDSESLRAWQHLNLSGIIDGEFTGTGTGTTHIPFENTPGTSRTGGGYGIKSLNQDNANMDNVHQVNGTNISVGGFDSASWPRGKLLSPPEAYYIDNKTDDGDPDDGKTQSRDYHNGSSWQNGCLNDDVDDGNRQYVKTTEDNVCIMFFDIR